MYRNQDSDNGHTSVQAVPAPEAQPINQAELAQVQRAEADIPARPSPAAAPHRSPEPFCHEEVLYLSLACRILLVGILPPLRSNHITPLSTRDRFAYDTFSLESLRAIALKSADTCPSHAMSSCIPARAATSARW